MGNLLSKATTYICKGILSGDFPPQSSLPPVDILAAKSGCSRDTVRRALRELAREGIVHSATSRGTTVLRAPSAGRVCVIQSQDEHTNIIFQNDICQALVRANFVVDVIPALADVHEMQTWATRVLGYSRSPVGLVIINPSMQDERERALLGKLAEQFNPRVYYVTDVQRPLWLPSGTSVLNDIQYSARLVAEHLLKLGHRRIGSSAGFHPGEMTVNARSADALADLLAVAGAKFFPHDERDGDDALYQRIKREKITAYWDMNDYSAALKLTQLAELGIRVPAQFSLLGRYDTPWATRTRPPLTTLSNNPPAVAKAIVAALTSSKHDSPHDTVLIKPELIVRASTESAR